MTLSLRALLFAALAASLLHIDARAEVPDGAALLPASTDAVQAMPPDGGEPVPEAKEPGKLILEIEPDGGIALNSPGAPRREILERLFAGREVEIEWRNKAIADERVRGRFRGPPSELARRLLDRTSYVMEYDTSSNEPRLARIVIIGSDSPAITRGDGASPPHRQEVSTGQEARRRAAIEAAKRAIAGAQRR